MQGPTISMGAAPALSMSEESGYRPAMTDEKPDNGRQDPRNHWCEHPGCKEWGGFGFARPEGTRWYCAEHRPDRD